jgi:uncharacterized protein YmfQ (DUF2313 family)
MQLNNFYSILRKLLPPGIFWHGRNFLNLILGISLVFDRIKSDINKILDECFPLTSTDLIDEWERNLGIDKPSDDLDKRRLEVAVRLVATGGNTEEFFISVVHIYDVNVQLMKSNKKKYFVVGKNKAGQKLGEKEFPSFTIIFNFKIKKYIELINLLDKLSPAHVEFIYNFEVK